MKIGFDVHGVLDRYPEVFKPLIESLHAQAVHELYVLSGSPTEKIVADLQLEGYDLKVFHRTFSIVDHHLTSGTTMELKNNGWWMPEDVWNRTKGDFASLAGLDFHFDNDRQYLPFFPKTCTTILVGDSFPSVVQLFSSLMR